VIGTLRGSTVRTATSGKATSMSTSTESGVQVTDNPERSRYDAALDGSQVGFAQYRFHGETIVFTHTEVADEFEGRGFSGKLAAGALDDARRQSLDVVPLCPFIAGYIARHPEYEEGLAPDYVDARAAAAAAA